MTDDRERGTIAYHGYCRAVCVVDRAAQTASIYRNSAEPAILTQEIVDDMQTTLEQFSAVVEGLRG